MSQQEQKIVTALAILGAAGFVLAVAAANPHCDRGCENNLQHILKHVLGDVVEGLLA